MAALNFIYRTLELLVSETFEKKILIRPELSNFTVCLIISFVPLLYLIYERWLNPFQQINNSLFKNIKENFNELNYNNLYYILYKTFDSIIFIHLYVNAGLHIEHRFSTCVRGFLRFCGDFKSFVKLTCSFFHNIWINHFRKLIKNMFTFWLFLNLYSPICRFIYLLVDW